MRKEQKGPDSRSAETALLGFEDQDFLSSSSAAPEAVYYYCPSYIYNEGSRWPRMSGLLPPQYTYVDNSHTPDIIFLRNSPGTFSEFHMYRRILKARQRYGWKPVVVSLSHEPVPLPDKAVDFSFHHSSSDGKNCEVFLPNIFKRWWPLRSEILKQPRRVEKNRFCCFIYSSSRPLSRVREDFCQLLAQYKRVDCPSARLNNMPRIDRFDNQGKMDFMANCKFSICFESHSSPWYLSEKLIHGFCAGTVPIYWGCPEASQYFNPAAFVNSHAYSSFEEVVEKVAEIDSSPSLYEEYLNAPPILPESRLYQIRRRTQIHYASIVNEALARRNRKRNRLLETFRLFFLVCSHFDVEIKKKGHVFYKVWTRFSKVLERLKKAKSPQNINRYLRKPFAPQKNNARAEAQRQGKA